MLVELHEEPFEAERDEVDTVLAGLADLVARVSSPVVRACLEEARDDILHLTARDAAAEEGEQAAE
jgi:hypothetical protein